MQKSGAAGFSFAKRRTVSSEYVTPVGFEYFGTFQIPFTAGSFTYSSTASMSGPSAYIGTSISSIPKCSVTPKWRSYPGDGQRNFTWLLYHGSLPRSPVVNAFEIRSYIMFRLELPPIKTFFSGTSSISAKSRLTSGIPPSTP